MDYLKDLIRPYKIALDDIDDAIAKSIDAVIFGGLSREEAVCHAAFMPELCMLPPGHLADHRMAGVPLPPLFVASPSDRDWKQADPQIEEWLGHLLNAPDWPGARSIVAKALRLNPARDAAELKRLGRIDPALLDALTCGGLGRSIQLIRAHNLDRHRDQILSMTSRMLIYFCAFSTQIVAARAWSYNHLPFRHLSGIGDYRMYGIAADFAEMATTLGKIRDYALQRSARGPNNSLRYEIGPQARRWQTAFGDGDVQQRASLASFYRDGGQRIDRAKRRLPSIEGYFKRNRQTVHRWVFGITAAEGLAFTVTRLLQLRDAAPTLVNRLDNNLPWHGLPLRTTKLPHLECVDVSNLLYVLRITILADQSGSIVTEASLPKPEFEEDHPDLRNMLQRPRASGNSLNFATLKDVRTKFNAGHFVRRRRVHGVLKAHEALDVIPEFWLQIDPGARVRPAPAVTVTPLSLRRLRIPRDKRGRPPNGYDQSG